MFGISFFATDLFAPLITISLGYGVSIMGAWTLFVLGSLLLGGMMAIKVLSNRHEKKLGKQF